MIIFNEDVELINISIEDSIAYVDLNKYFEFTKDGNGVGDLWVSLYINTIVYTLCLNKFLNIDSVQF